MQEPTLVILAAGMGSRFGGLKQIMPVDEHGHAIFRSLTLTARAFAMLPSLLKKRLRKISRPLSADAWKSILM